MRFTRMPLHAEAAAMNRAQRAHTEGLPEQALPVQPGLSAPALAPRAGSTLAAVAYVSTADTPLAVPELERLHQQAMARNGRHGVTGVLLYNDGNFMQYIEGPAAEVDRLYQSIRADVRHRALIELLNEPVAHRSFAQWHMGLAQATDSDVLALSTASWEQVRAATATGQANSTGLTLLLSFWQQEQA
jgi:Sensors of blue-light using FAD